MAHIALGVMLLVVLALLRRFAPRFPGALAALVLGAVAVALLELASKGVAIIGAVPAGLPGFSVPKVSLGDIGTLVPLAGGLAFVVFAQSILTARAFAERHGEMLDANQELVALGVGNIGAGLRRGFPSSSSQSRTAVAETAGRGTQLAQAGPGCWASASCCDSQVCCMTVPRSRWRRSSSRPRSGCSTSLQ